LQAKSTPNPLHINPNNSGATLTWPEGGDRQPREVTQVAFAVADRLRDSLLQRLDVNLFSLASLSGLGSGAICLALLI
jgi:hypothetical protein